MLRSKACNALCATLALSALCHGGQGETKVVFPAGYLDWAKVVSWSDVKDLSRAEIAADKALREGRREEAKLLLYGLLKSGHDCVLVRKGFLDLDASSSALHIVVASQRRRRQSGIRLTHADLLEAGYAVAMLAKVERGTSDLNVNDALAGLRQVLKEGPTLPERVAVGEILSQIGDLGEMRHVLAEAARLAPRRAGVQLACAWSLVHIGNKRYKSRPSDALPYALTAVREDPGRADAYAAVAGCYAEMGDQTRANRYYVEYVKHGVPGSPGVEAVKTYLSSRGVRAGS